MRKTGFKISSFCLLLTLASAGAAWAHVEVSPGRVSAGAAETFTIEVPTEKEIPTTEVRLELPEGFEATGAGAPDGWQGGVQGNVLVWKGGEIPVANSEEFSFEATVSEEAGRFSLDATQTYRDGSVVEWTGAADSEEPAPVIEILSDGQAGDEEPGDAHGSHEEVPDTGGPGPAVLLAGCALALAAATTVLARAIRR